MKICPFLVAGQDLRHLRQTDAPLLITAAADHVGEIELRGEIERSDRAGGPTRRDAESGRGLEPRTAGSVDIDLQDTEAGDIGFPIHKPGDAGALPETPLLLETGAAEAELELTGGESTPWGTGALRDAGARPSDMPAPTAVAEPRSAAPATFRDEPPHGETARAGLWEIEDASDPLAAFACLREPCRFYHAGACRFDALFAAPTLDSERRGIAASAEATSTAVEAAGVAAGALAGAAPPADGDAALAANGALLGSVLQEVRSLQRESLKELIGGFRRLEVTQTEQQSALCGQVEGLVSRLEDGRATPPADLLRLLEDRFEALARSVEQIGGTLRGVATESGAGLQGTLASIDASCKQAQAGLERLQAQVRGELGDIGAQLRAASEGTRTTVREAVERAAGESRAELERGLSRVAGGSQEMRALHGDLQTLLTALQNDVREAAATAGKLESSAQRTQELLAEQRQIAASERERERRAEARRLNNAGVLAYHQGAYDTSVQQFRRALELDPRLAEAWNNLALTHTEMHADAEALEAFKKALELDPSVAQVYNNVGYLYHRRGELQSAVEMYERATQRSSDTGAAWANLANALYEMRRVDEAVAAWKRALEIDPANDKAAAALERLGLGAASRA